MKLLSWNKYGCEYSYKGLVVIGTMYSTSEFLFSFPKKKMKSPLKITNKGSFSPILDKYNIPTFGEDYRSFFEKTAKEELENELEKLMKDELNQKVLIMMLFEDILIMGDKK